MVVGHYTTALVAKRLDPEAPLWLFLLASMFLDFLMAGLVAFDLVAGFPHFWMGPETPAIGVGLYHSAPLTALAIEAIVAFACVGYFLRGSSLSPAKKAGLVATTLFGVAVMIPGSI
jgi:hypothetical protein